MHELKGIKFPFWKLIKEFRTPPSTVGPGVLAGSGGRDSHHLKYYHVLQECHFRMQRNLCVFVCVYSYGYFYLFLFFQPDLILIKLSILKC